MQHFIKHIYVKKKNNKKEATSMFPILWHELHSFLVFFLFSPNDPFQVDNTILIWVRLGVRNVMHMQQIQLQLTWSVS